MPLVHVVLAENTRIVAAGESELRILTELMGGQGSGQTGSVNYKAPPGAYPAPPLNRRTREKSEGTEQANVC